jgi:hypothetical protein
MLNSRSNGGFSRRALLALLAPAMRLAAGTTEVMPAGNGLPSRVWRQQYRANAAVTFFSIPLVSRAAVGSGFALIEECVSRGAKAVAIQFGAGSFPNRARGLNRLGYIKEEIVEAAPGKPLECAYFAFMTTSQEKNLDQAKRAIEVAHGMIPYSAAEGSGQKGHFASRVSRFNFPSELTWRDCPELVRRVRSAMSLGSEGQRAEKDLPRSTAAPATFLYAVRAAMLDPARKTDSALVYNGKDYRLRTEKNFDTAMEAHFGERNLVPDSNRVVRLDAVLEEVTKNVKTPFRVWFESGNELMPPLAFEYQARSFLRLYFEADFNTSVPAVSLALNKIAQ